MKKRTNLHDLTADGSIAPRLALLALPLLLSNILQQLYNMIDAAVLGRFVGADAFSAIGIAGTVMNLFLFLLTGACTGVSVLLSRLYGAGGDGRRMRKAIFQAIFFGSLLTLSISLVFLLFCRPLLILIRTPESLLALVAGYLRIILGGLMFSFAYNLLSAILRSLGDTFATLLFLGISIITNILLDFWFVAYLHTGIAGAAWATILSQLLSAVCSFLYLRKKYPALILRREDFGVDLPLLKQTVQFASASALQMASIYIGKILIQGIVNSLGLSAIAAYTAATRIEGFANSFGDSGTAAEAVFIGQNAGAGNRKQVAKGTSVTLAMMISFGLVMGLLMILGGPPFLRWLLPKGDPEAYRLSLSYLRTVAYFYPLCFLGCANVGFFQGTGRIYVPMFCSPVNLGSRIIFSLLLTGKYSLTGVALATGIGWALIVTVHQVVKVRGTSVSRRGT